MRALRLVSCRDSPEIVTSWMWISPLSFTLTVVSECRVSRVRNGVYPTYENSTS